MKRFLPHLNLSLAICMIVIFYVDNRNPYMGFLKSPVSYIYLFAFALITLIDCIIWICDSAKTETKKDYSGKFER